MSTVKKTGAQALDCLVAGAPGEVTAEELLAADHELDRLRNLERFLDCLRSAGVDNWEWYDVACEEYQS